MTDNKTVFDRLVRVLEFKMPVNKVGNNEIKGCEDEIRLIAKDKENSLILFIIDRDGSSRTEHVVTNVLDDHNSKYHYEEPDGEMAEKIIVTEADEETFTR